MRSQKSLKLAPTRLITFLFQSGQTGHPDKRSLTMPQKFILFQFIIITIFLAGPHVTQAYIGPGAGIAAIGTVIALVAGVLLAIVAFLWYPIKRLLAKIKQKRLNDQESTRL